MTPNSPQRLRERRRTHAARVEQIRLNTLRLAELRGYFAARDARIKAMCDIQPVVERSAMMRFLNWITQ